MKIVVIADTHGVLPIIPPCDVLLLGGDVAPDMLATHFSMWDPDKSRADQMHWLSTDYLSWEAYVPAKHILVTPGNHDWWTKLPEMARSRVLIDEGVIIDNVSFWMTPWTSKIPGWNYMLDAYRRRERFLMIPSGIDMLVSHGPMFGYLDRTYTNIHAGCPELLDIVKDRKPAHFFHGHIHEGNRDGYDIPLNEWTTVHHVSVIGGNREPRQFDIEPYHYLTGSLPNLPIISA